MAVRRRRWVHFGAWTAAVLLLSVLAVRLRVTGGDVALWWPAAGVSAAAVVCAPRDQRRMYVAMVAFASGLGNVLGGQVLLVSACFGMANAAETAVVAAVLLRGARPRPDLSLVIDLGRLVAAAAAGALLAAVGVAATVAALLDGSFAGTLRSVFASHASAVLLLVPLWLARRQEGARVLEMVPQLAALLGTLALVFRPGQDLPLSFLPLGPLLWIGLRQPARWVALAVLSTGAVVGVLTVQGGGPFAAAGARAADPALTATLVQAFVLVCWLATMAMAVSSTQRRDALEHSAASEALFRGSFADAVLGMALVHRHRGDVRVVECNAAAARILGVDPDELPGTSLDEYLDDAGRRTWSDALEVASETGSGGWHGELSVAPARGDAPRWAEIALSRVSASDTFSVQLIDVTARRRAEARLRELALHDSLTGLPNRTLLRDRIEQALSTARRTGEEVSALFVDLDGFKTINDTHGHESGDAVLVEVSRRLVHAVRESDTVARVGGDEFVVLCPHLPPAQERLVLDRVLTAFEEPVRVREVDLRVGASIGLAAVDGHADANDLLREADAAMYAVKSSGGGRQLLLTDSRLPGMPAEPV